MQPSNERRVRSEIIPLRMFVELFTLSEVRRIGVSEAHGSDVAQ